MIKSQVVFLLTQSGFKQPLFLHRYSLMHLPEKRKKLVCRVAITTGQLLA